MDTLLSTITQRNIAIQKVIEEIRRFYTSCQINDKLNI